MREFLIIVKREAQSNPEIAVTLTRENRAIIKADHLYNQNFLDSVAVIEVDRGIKTRVYLRTRNCKHPNVQFTLTSRGEIAPTCETCGLVILKSEEIIEEK